MDEEAKDLNMKLKAIESERVALEDERKRIIEKIQYLHSEADKVKNQLYLLESKKIASINWAKKHSTWDDKMRDILNNTFNLKSFRFDQLSAINAILSKCDVILLMPTGGGKSLCYQLPALITDGVTIVISPLLSLIEDQIIALQKLNIPCIALNSNTNKEDTKKVYASLVHGPIKYKLIYVTPEWIAKSKRFKNNLQKCYENKKLDRIAIDEVHCCSQWGHDFRPDYKHLGILRVIFPDVPIIGVTATATENILVDMQKMLNLRECLILKSSYNRPNLHYEVRQKPVNPAEFIETITDLIKNKYENQSGIIYTNTINDSVDLAIALKNRGVAVACYHANLTAEQRSKVHVKWLENRYKVVVATVAFGMGIDKPDVRFIIHHTIPKSMANYYQESGRAGRDNLKADCILYYSAKDVFKLSPMVSSSHTGSENLYQVVEYCLDVKKCRRLYIASHFNDVWTKQDCNKMCDHCCNPEAFKTVDITDFYKDMCTVLQTENAGGHKLTANKLVAACLKNNASKKKPLIAKELAENIVTYLIINNYFKEDLHFTAYSTICYIRQTNKILNTKVLMDVPLSVPNISLIPVYKPTEVIEIDDDDPCQYLNKTKESNNIEQHKITSTEVKKSIPVKVNSNEVIADKPNKSINDKSSTSRIKRKDFDKSKKSLPKKMKIVEKLKKD